MKKIILAMTMAAIAIVFVLELSMEQFFISKRQDTAETMAGSSQPVSAAEEKMPEIYAVFGVDTETGDAGRSDCIMLISLDESSDTVRMCSIARDTLVTVPGQKDETKLGHAYALGGPELAMETINENFGTDITEYVTVNFSQMAELVDLMGGVEIPLTQKEWHYLGLGSKYLGEKKLDGEEALTYCRIRSIDSDDMRTARQRTLISALLQELREVPRTRLPGLIGEGMKLCRTNIGFSSLLHLGKSALCLRSGIKTDGISLPGDAVSAWGGTRDDGVWYYVYDLNRASEVLREFFYGADAKQVSA